MIRHAVPYAQPSSSCRCPVQECGALLPEDACPDHGHRRTPAMEWHTAGNEYCRRLAAEAQR